MAPVKPKLLREYNFKVVLAALCLASLLVITYFPQQNVE